VDNETQKIIEEQLKQLPADVKAAIISVDYKTKLQEITQRQKLMIDQAGKLEMETTLVMIGLEPLADFISNLQRELNLTEVRAKEVALDVSENIFKAIRDSLQKMNEAVEEKPALVPVEPDLNREQILNEIENPAPLRPNSTMPVPNSQSTTIEVRPTQEVEIKPVQNLMETKMSDITITTKQIIDAKTENKLPEIEKKRPTSGVDPYREPLA